MRLTSGDVQRCINQLLHKEKPFQCGDLASLANISRQAAHRHLRKRVQQGLLESVGSGRATAYRRKPQQARVSLAIAGLEEDQIWKHQIAPQLDPHRPSKKAEDIMHYAFTEMLNNAIDHSKGTEVEIVLEIVPSHFRVSIKDDGVGAFERIKRALKLPDYPSAIQELSKGKFTTQPSRHTGEGIFFTSKAVSFFQIEANEFSWMVDNRRNDTAIGSSMIAQGTRVQFIVDHQPTRTLKAIFDEFTDDFQFTRTKTTIKLFTYGTAFISRSEAKRLVRGLEQFKEIIVDFTAVESVGQGFCDEVFRVWANEHPQSQLIPIRMSEAVSFMVQRALQRR